MLPLLALAFYMCINMTALYLYGSDKFAAQRGQRRTPEAKLLYVSLLGGAFGGLLAMLLFRHKTLKLIFWSVNVLGAAGHLFLIGLMLQTQAS